MPHSVIQISSLLFLSLLRRIESFQAQQWCSLVQDTILVHSHHFGSAIVSAVQPLLGAQILYWLVLLGLLLFDLDQRTLGRTLSSSWALICSERLVSLITFSPVSWHRCELLQYLGGALFFTLPIHDDVLTNLYSAAVCVAFNVQWHLHNLSASDLFLPGGYFIIK